MQVPCLLLSMGKFFYRMMVEFCAFHIKDSFAHRPVLTVVDLDFSNYERFLDVTLTRDNNISTRKIYLVLVFSLNMEIFFLHLTRKEKVTYLGKTVQIIPHITFSIRNWIESVAVIPFDGKEGPTDVCVMELGRTVGTVKVSRNQTCI